MPLSTWFKHLLVWDSKKTSRKRTPHRPLSRRNAIVPRLEQLEDRLVPANYSWSGNGTALVIQLNTNESVTVSNPSANTVAFTLSGPGTDTWTQTGSTAASGGGNGTATITFNAAGDLSASIAIDNSIAGAGENDVTFATGTISSGSISVDTTQGNTATGNIVNDAAVNATGGGAITLTASGSIDANGGSFGTTGVLTTSSVGETTLEGANTVGSINATDGGLQDFDFSNTAATLVVTGINQTGGGEVDITNTGAVNITGSVSTTGVQVTLSATGAISETGAGLIDNSAPLLIENSAGVSMNGANVVGNFTDLDNTGGAISFSNTTALAISGIAQNGTTAGDDVSVTSTGDLTTFGAITTTAAANGNISLAATDGNETIGAAVTAGGSVSLFAGTFTITNASSITGAGVTFRSDHEDLQPGSSITAINGGEVNLRVNTVGVDIDLGTGGGAGSLNLDQGELNTITAGDLRVTASQNIVVTSAVTLNPANVPTLYLDASLGEAMDNGATDTITATNLAIQTGNGISLDTIVSNLAFSNTGGAVDISNTGALTIAAVNTITTSSNTGTTTTLSAASPMTFAVNTTSTGTITADTTNTPTTTDGVITVDTGVTVESTGGDVDFNAGADIDLAAGSIVTSDMGTVSLIADAGGTDANAQLNLDGTINGVNITLSAPTNITLGVLSATGTISITSTNGAILDGTAPTVNITADTLQLSAGTGIGVVLDGGVGALQTQVSILGADTSTGGIFIDNGVTTPITLNIEGTDGVEDTGASGDIVLTNAGTVNLLTSGDSIFSVNGSVTVTATGATSNVVVDAGPTSTGIVGGVNATVQAGQDILVGSATGTDTINAGSGVATLTAGRDVIIDNGAQVGIASGQPGSLTVSAGRNISLQATTTQGALIATSGGSITLTTGAGDTFTNNSGAGGGVFSNVAGGNGNITISADIMVIDDSIDAGTGIVTLQPVTTGRNIDLGTNPSTGNLGLAQSDLNEVTAGILRIGSNIAGTINVSAAITNPATWNTLTLINGSTITEAPAGSLTVTDLAVDSTGPVTLGSANHVTTLAASTTGAFTFNNGTNTLTVGVVDGDTGITTIGSNINLSADAMDLTQQVSTGSTTAGIVTLTPFTASNSISIGGANGPGTLGLDDTDFSNITAAVVRVGSSSQTGAISIDGNITTHAGYNTIDLIATGSGGSIVENSGSITVAKLALQADAGIGDAGAIDVVGPINVAFNNATSGAVQIQQRRSADHRRRGWCQHLGERWSAHDVHVPQRRQPDHLRREHHQRGDHHRHHDQCARYRRWRHHGQWRGHGRIDRRRRGLQCCRRYRSRNRQHREVRLRDGQPHCRQRQWHRRSQRPVEPRRHSLRRRHHPDGTKHHHRERPVRYRHHRHHLHRREHYRAWDSAVNGKPR